MKFICFVLLLAAFPLAAQKVEKSKPDPVPLERVKFLELQYLGKDGSDRLNRLGSVIQQLMPGQASIISDPTLKVLAIRGTVEGIAKAEEMLRRYDVPNPAPASRGTRQIQLLIHVLETSESASTVPGELTAAVDQLRKAFGIRDFRLNETLLLQSAESSPFTLNGTLTLEGDGQKRSTYSAQYKWATYSEFKTVRVEGFDFHIRGTGASSSITTSLNIPEGQTLVLGKLSRDENARPIFLVITAKADQP